jgi:hypothetical protein
MNKQKEILNRIANEYGLQIQQAEEIWDLFCEKIKLEIIKNKKDEDGFYDLSKFPVIHIDNFGKFVPIKQRILFANNVIKKKREDDTQS